MTPPLPDASKKSPRVYRNLKTKTLEDVTFSNVEATGDPLSIEMHNEDELRRLVLVQLARLTVKSEWSGLLTAGGGVTFPLEAPNGTSSAPSYSFSGDTNTGMYLTSGDVLSFSAAGSEKLRISASGLQVIPDGSALTPGISFSGDTQTGFFQPATNNVAIATNAGERFRVSAAGQIGLSGANYGTDGQVLTSKGSGAAVEWSTPSSGGTSSYAPVPIGVALDASGSNYNIWDVMAMAPFGIANYSSTTQNSKQSFFPFISPATGDVGKFHYNVTSSATATQNAYFAIYETDSDGVPSNVLGYATIDVQTESGVQSTSTFSSTISLTKGVQYFIAWNGSTSATYQMQGINRSTFAPQISPKNSLSGFGATNGFGTYITSNSNNFSTPATASAQDLEPGPIVSTIGYAPQIGIEFS